MLRGPLALDHLIDQLGDLPSSPATDALAVGGVLAMLTNSNGAGKGH